MEEQATEREQERDDFSKEIEKLRIIVKEKDKDKTSQCTLEKEVRRFFIQVILLTLITQLCICTQLHK